MSIIMKSNFPTDSFWLKNIEFNELLMWCLLLICIIYDNLCRLTIEMNMFAPIMSTFIKQLLVKMFTLDFLVN